MVTIEANPSTNQTTSSVTNKGIDLQSLPYLTFIQNNEEEDKSARISQATVSEMGEFVVEFNLNFKNRPPSLITNDVLQISIMQV